MKIFKVSSIISTYCAWCKKHMNGKELGVNHPSVSHGICKKCKNDYFKEDFDILKEASLGEYESSESSESSADVFEIKTIKYSCPKTGTFMLVHMLSSSNDVLRIELYDEEDNFISDFDNFWHAKNWAKKHIEDCEISNMGKKIR
jgi:hypothetical protein